MTDQKNRQSDVTRLESLWSGEFGDKYIERNRSAGESRGPFWTAMLEKLQVQRALEVGCNTGANLRWLRDRVPQIYGIDVSETALRDVRQSMPDINAVHAAGRDLPFRDQWFDLVYTMGVLIHQPIDSLPLVMSEIVRCSRRYVLCGEYYADAITEVPYRGHAGALFKRDFGGLYQTLFPELVLRDKGFLSKDDGWDDVTWWLFEKTYG